MVYTTVAFETAKTVVKSVVDATVDGVDAVYGREPDSGGGGGENGGNGRSTSSVQYMDPKDDC